MSGPAGDAAFGPQPSTLGDGDEVTLRDGERLPADFAVECRFVAEQLAIGGMVGTRRNVRALATLGITHVINLQLELDEGPIFAGSGLELCWLGVPDALEPFPRRELAAALDFAAGARRRRRHCLLVHCMAGRNRSPLFAWALLRAEGLSAAAATSAIRRVEPTALLRDEHLEAAESALAAWRMRA